MAANITCTYPSFESRFQYGETFSGNDIDQAIDVALKTPHPKPFLSPKTIDNLPFTVFHEADHITLIGRVKVIRTDSKVMRLGLRVTLKNRLMEPVACIKMDGRTKENQNEVEKISLLKGLISGIVETYTSHAYVNKKNQSKILLVQQLCEKGNLYDYRMNHQPYSVERFLHQVAKSLYQFHQKNLLFMNLCDSNIFLKGDEFILGGVGSVSLQRDYAYLVNRFSPVDALLAEVEGDNFGQHMEVVCELNTPPRDIWALGVILWALIFGDYPRFSYKIGHILANAETTKTSYNLYHQVKAEIKEECAQSITMRPEFKTRLWEPYVTPMEPSTIHELLAVMLHPVPGKRPTADQIVALMEKFNPLENLMANLNI